jgi:hypothetical protein
VSLSSAQTTGGRRLVAWCNKTAETQVRATIIDQDDTVNLAILKMPDSPDNAEKAGGH